MNRKYGKHGPRMLTLGSAIWSCVAACMVTAVTAYLFGVAADVDRPVVYNTSEVQVCPSKEQVSVGSDVPQGLWSYETRLFYELCDYDGVIVLTPTPIELTDPR